MTKRVLDCNHTKLIHPTTSVQNHGIGTVSIQAETFVTEQIVVIWRIHTQPSHCKDDTANYHEQLGNIKSDFVSIPLEAHTQFTQDTGTNHTKQHGKCHPRLWCDVCCPLGTLNTISSHNLHAIESIQKHQ